MLGLPHHHPHTRLQASSLVCSLGALYGFSFIPYRESISLPGQARHLGIAEGAVLFSPVPLGPVGLCCTLTQGAREPGGGHTSQPFGVLLLRAGFASDKSTINSTKDWHVLIGWQVDILITQTDL